jgi:serine/threonine protein kinase/tetratricopeptide (TPR) repeat protein
LPRVDVNPPNELSQRFTFKRRLGEGAFGAVWEVYDTKERTRVALKSLLRSDPNSVIRFKREFRSLADLVHPNLVTLYELFALEEPIAFTMELIEGVDFVRWVTHAEEPADVSSDDAPTHHEGELPPVVTLREAGLASSAVQREGAWYDQPTQLSDGDRSGDRSAPAVVRAPHPSRPRVLDPERLRDATRQLVTGLLVLHQAGMLHRDVKPSNVLVSRKGRVKILDFGLIAEVAPEHIAESADVIVGTPGYMSPEQALGNPLDHATDWYAVGAMLYVALTGRPVFEGPPSSVIRQQHYGRVTPPSTHVPGLPADLESLCVDLLAKSPRERPSGEAILARLGGTVATTGRQRPGNSAAPRSGVRHAFVGREAELRALERAFEHTRRGGAAVAWLHGPSGMGKSALLRELCGRIRGASADAVILSGRCFSQETVAYKALDSVIDELSMFLRGLPDAEATVLLPVGAWALGRLFPVLEQVDVIAAASHRAPAVIDPQEQRRRAFRAIRELLARIAEQRPLVIVIDDLQWGDLDSNAVLAEILRAPDPPNLLLVAGYRLEDPSAEPLVELLEGGAMPHVHLARVPVRELGPAEARQLAISLVGEDATVLADAITREALGNPFFIEALARYALARGATDGHYASVPLADVIRAELDELPPAARRLLEAIALAGRPLELGVAQRAAGPESQDQSLLPALSAKHFVRRAAGPGEPVECYHDRVREAVVAGLQGAARGRLHELLGLALEETGRARAEELMAHFEAAGRAERATKYALAAAAIAEQTLAFDHAAQLYTRAFALDPSLGTEVRVKLGEALANAGRGRAAAEAFLLAAKGAAAGEGLRLRQRAAEQLLISGHVDEGLRTVREVLDTFGMRVAESPKGALFSLVARRARLRVRGLKFKERAESEVPAEDLLRVDACWAVSVGLSLVDNIRGADYQARHLLLALQAGEPNRVARALSVEIAYQAAAGSSTRERALELVRTSTALAERTQNAHALGLAMTMAGAADFLVGHFAEAFELAERGGAILRERCVGVAWELDTAEVFVLSSLHRLGRWRMLRERLDEVLRDANARGDLYMHNQARLDAGWNVDLAADAPELAEAHVAQAFAPSASRDFDTQHYLHLNARANIALYRAEGREAYQRVTGAWPDLKRSFTLEIQMVHMDLLDLRARSAIAAACASSDADERRALLKVATKDAARIDQERLEWTLGSAWLIRAAVASVEGRAEAALAHLDAAIGACDRSRLGLLASVARWRKAQLLGPAGLGLLHEVDAALRAEGIRRPDRLAAMLCPGRFAG